MVSPILLLVQKGKTNETNLINGPFTPPEVTEHAAIKSTSEPRQHTSTDLKTIFADDLLIWGKEEKQTQEKLHQQTLIIKKHVLEMYRLSAMKIQRNPYTTIRTKVNATRIQTADVFT
jgi:hypothetical protein